MKIVVKMPSKAVTVFCKLIKIYTHSMPIRMKYQMFYLSESYDNFSKLLQSYKYAIS